MKKIVLLAVSALMALADPKALYTEKCASCHGDNGKMTDVAGKAIAGLKDAEAKLNAYKAGNGGAQKDMMIPVAKELSDAQVKALASFIAGMK